MIGAARGLYAKKRSAGGGGTISYVDAASDGGASITSYTLTAKPNVSGTNRMLVAFVHVEHTAGAGANNVTSVTWNGTNMTFLARAESGNLSSFWNLCEIWYLIAPATGANNLVATIPSSATGLGVTGIALSGVAQTAPEANASTNSGTSSVSTVNFNITTLTNNAWVVDGVSHGSGTGTYTFTSPQVERADTAGGGQRNGASTREVTTAGSVNQQVTSTASSRMAYIGASFAPA